MEIYYCMGCGRLQNWLILWKNVERSYKYYIFLLPWKRNDDINETWLYFTSLVLYGPFHSSLFASCHFRYDSNPQTTDSESGGSDDQKKEKSKPKKEKKEKPKKPRSEVSQIFCSHYERVHLLLCSKFLFFVIFCCCFFKSDKPRKKKRKEKDANRPKRPPSAYFLWFTEMREQIKTDNPGISFTDIAKKGGELWKKLGSKEKEVSNVLP